MTIDEDLPQVLVRRCTSQNKPMAFAFRITSKRNTTRTELVPPSSSGIRRREGGYLSAFEHTNKLLDMHQRRSTAKVYLYAALD